MRSPSWNRPPIAQPAAPAGADEFRADQHGDADERQHVDPVDRTFGVHGALRASKRRKGYTNRPRRASIARFPANEPLPVSETAVYSRAAVAAPHRLAAEAGRDVLAQGGNAIEAMVAMAATIAVVYPHNELDRRRRLLADPRARRAGAGDRGLRLRRRGRVDRRLPRARPRRRSDPRAEGGADACPARSAAGRWRSNSPARAAAGCRCELLLEDAVRRARDGCPVSASEARFDPRSDPALVAAPGFADDLPRRRQAGRGRAIRRAPRLADTLEQLARAGLDDFYRGDVGREIAADLERIGSPITRDDLEALSRRMARAAVAAAEDGDALQHAGADARARLADAARPLRAAGAGQAGRLRPRPRADRSGQARDGDPRPGLRRFRPSRRTTSTRCCRRRISTARRRRSTCAAPRPGRCKPDKGDTVWMGAIDADGLAVSFIQSVYLGIRLGLRAAATGVLMQNRGVAFSLDPKARNPLEAGAAAVPHPQPAARRVRRRPRPRLRLEGRRRAAAVPGAGLHPHRRRRAARRRARRAAPFLRPRLGRAGRDGQARGGLRRRRRGGACARRATRSSGARGRARPVRPRRRADARAARARSPPRTTRARTAARRGFEAGRGHSRNRRQNEFALPAAARRDWRRGASAY